jgi:tellurite resistance protein TehA-like permease
VDEHDRVRDPRGDDLGDLLQEIRVLIQGAQVLTAFLVILPFSAGFDDLSQAERWVYVATFALAVLALVLFSAPAAQHRLARPLLHRDRFKDQATRFLIVGLACISIALVLATQLVVSEVVGARWSLFWAGAVAVGVLVFWWIYPLHRRSALSRPDPPS